MTSNANVKSNRKSNRKSINNVSGMAGAMVTAVQWQKLWQSNGNSNGRTEQGCPRLDFCLIAIDCRLRGGHTRCVTRVSHPGASQVSLKEERLLWGRGGGLKDRRGMNGQKD